MDQSKHIDALVTDYTRQLEGADALGRKIEASASFTVVLFIDLADSTAMKAAMPPRNWLAHVFTFIGAVKALAERNNGTVVKRIGDEVMLTFPTIADTERMLDAMDDQRLHDAFRFKIAADCGTAFHFQFESGLANDPYGTVVDRCARIAKYAKTGTILCSGDYAKAVGDPKRYFQFGLVSLKGIPEPVVIYLRNVKDTHPSQEYLQPLLDALNDPGQQWTGYRYSTRAYSATCFSFRPSPYGARPFLLRELVTVPRLPFSYVDFLGKCRELDDDAMAQYIGYYVEWEASFFSCTREGGFLQGGLTDPTEKFLSPVLSLELVPEMYEVMRGFKKNELVRVAGIITSIDRMNIGLNYVSILHTTTAH